MPYLRGKLKGELKVPEIRKLVKLHNELSKIKIPPKSSRDDIIALIEKKGYKVDHEAQAIVQVSRPLKKKITLKMADEAFPKVSKAKKVVVQPTEPQKDLLKIEDKPEGKVVKKASSVKVKVTKPKVAKKAPAKKAPVPAPAKKAPAKKSKKLSDKFLMNFGNLKNNTKPGSKWHKKMKSAKTLKEIKDLMNVYTKLSTPVDELVSNDDEEETFENYDAQVRGFRDERVAEIKSKK